LGAFLFFPSSLEEATNVSSLDLLTQRRIQGILIEGRAAYFSPASGNT